MKTLARIILTVLAVGAAEATLQARQLGDYTLTYGYESVLRPRHEEEGSNSQRVKGSLTIGLSDNTYFRVGNTNLVSRQRADGTRVNGIGSTSLSFGAAIVNEDETGVRRYPAVSAEYTVVLPTASKALGSFRGTDHAFGVSLEKSIGAPHVIGNQLYRRNVVGLDLGAYLGEKEEGGYSKTPEMMMAFSHIFGDVKAAKYSYRGELYLSAPTKDSLSEIYALNQMSIKFQPKTRFTAGFRAGITPNSPRLVFFGKVSFSGSFR